MLIFSRFEAENVVKTFLKRHCHEHTLKNSTAQKHVYTVENLLTVVKFSYNYYTSVLKLNIK